MENNNFIHTDKKLVVKGFVAEKAKAIGKPDRKGKVTYVPQPKMFRKPFKLQELLAKSFS